MFSSKQLKLFSKIWGYSILGTGKRKYCSCQKIRDKTGSSMLIKFLKTSRFCWQGEKLVSEQWLTVNLSHALMRISDIYWRFNCVNQLEEQREGEVGVFAVGPSLFMLPILMIVSSQSVRAGVTIVAVHTVTTIWERKKDRCLDRQVKFWGWNCDVSVDL